jgi:hypothetical protein
MFLFLSTKYSYKLYYETDVFLLSFVRSYYVVVLVMILEIALIS